MERMKKVLVIEDMDLMRDVLCDVLASSGFDVSCCSDGGSAVSAAEKNIFDIFITDYDMPVMSGVEVTEQVRNHCSSSMIIGMSCDNKSEEFLRAGADAFVQKPFDHEDLLALINR